MTDKHPLYEHARALENSVLNAPVINWKKSAAAVLRVELTRKPTTDELNEAMREITWATELSDNAGLRCTVNAALKSAIAARLKMLEIE